MSLLKLKLLSRAREKILKLAITNHEKIKASITFHGKINYPNHASRKKYRGPSSYDETHVLHILLPLGRARSSILILCRKCESFECGIV